MESLYGDRHPITEGIPHGPYNRMPDEMMAHYLSLFDAELPGHASGIPREQYADDRESEWQYEEHATAISDACSDPAVYTHPRALGALTARLRPWLIMYRHPSDK